MDNLILDVSVSMRTAHSPNRHHTITRRYQLHLASLHQPDGNLFSRMKRNRGVCLSLSDLPCSGHPSLWSVTCNHSGSVAATLESMYPRTWSVLSIIMLVELKSSNEERLPGDCRVANEGVIARVLRAQSDSVIRDIQGERRIQGPVGGTLNMRWRW